MFIAPNAVADYLQPLCPSAASDWLLAVNAILLRKILYNSASKFYLVSCDPEDFSLRLEEEYRVVS